MPPSPKDKIVKAIIDNKIGTKLPGILITVTRKEMVDYFKTTKELTEGSIDGLLHKEASNSNNTWIVKVNDEKRDGYYQVSLNDDDYKKILGVEIQKSSQGNTDDRLKRLKEAQVKPEKIQTLHTIYRRNPDVVAEVLFQAKGKCRKCGKDAPFIRASDKTPYLEVHHTVRLADGGDDTVANAIALCPNCHRKLHFG